MVYESNFVLLFDGMSLQSVLRYCIGVFNQTSNNLTKYRWNNSIPLDYLDIVKVLAANLDTSSIRY